MLMTCDVYVRMYQVISSIIMIGLMRRYLAGLHLPSNKKSCAHVRSLPHLCVHILPILRWPSDFVRRLILQARAAQPVLFGDDATFAPIL